MPNADGWSLIDVPHIERLPRSVFLRSENLAPHQGFAPHTHPWNQFVYATSGTLMVTVQASRYVITPEQAIWIPTEVPHATTAIDGAAFRNLYVNDAPDLGMPDCCTVYSVSALMRALIVELEGSEQRGEADEYIRLLHGLMLAQLKRLAVLDFHLPWPQGARLRGMCESLYANPADLRSLDEWGRELGLSGRTLARRFEHEVGITLREWRRRLRLFLALEWLCSQRSTTTIALELGYATVSAFTYMFRQEMGCTPSQWRSAKGLHAGKQ